MTHQYYAVDKNVSPLCKSREQSPRLYSKASTQGDFTWEYVPHNVSISLKSYKLNLRSKLQRFRASALAGPPTSHAKPEGAVLGRLPYDS